MLDDYVLAASATMITAAVVILGTLLRRYRSLVKEADASTRLAKDVWDSVSTRFSVVDARIIDLMAKTDVLTSRFGPVNVVSQPRSPSAGATNVAQKGPPEIVREPQAQALGIDGTDTEIRVLRLLSGGPRSTAQIKEEVGRSREHTARLMKALFDRGLVVRNDRNKPYVYEITESGRSYVAS